MLEKYHIIRVRVSKDEYYSAQDGSYLGLATYDAVAKKLCFSDKNLPTALHFNCDQEYKISGKRVGEEAAVAVTNFTVSCVKNGSGADQALEFTVSEVKVKAEGVTMN